MPETEQKKTHVLVDDVSSRGSVTDVCFSGVFARDRCCGENSKQGRRLEMAALGGGLQFEITRAGLSDKGAEDRGRRVYGGDELIK